MGKHHQQKPRRARTAALAGAAAAGVSSALVLGTATGATVNYDVNLVANTIIGVGGRDDPNADRVQTKLMGGYAFDFDGDYARVVYPANVLFQSSIDVGIPALKDQIDVARDPETGDPDGRIRVVSYSEGTLIAEQVKRDLAAAGQGAPTDAQLDFVFMASPYSPNGGVFARFPGFRIPGLLPEFGAAQPTTYDSIYVTNEYDGFADFPAYFNLLAMANAFAGMAYAHPDQYYDAIDLDQLVEGEGKYTKTVANGAGGTDTYVFVRNPSLPLLAPIRQIAALVQLTALTEPVLSAIEPLLRVAVDAGYTDRVNANPEKPTTFSFITPPAATVAAVTKAPDTLREGAANPTDEPTQPGTSNRVAAETDLADSDLAPASRAPKKPKPESKDPLGEVSSAIEKGLRSTVGPAGPRVSSTTITTADDSPTTDTDTDTDTDTKDAKDTKDETGDAPDAGAPEPKADAA